MSERDSNENITTEEAIIEPLADWLQQAAPNIGAPISLANLLQASLTPLTGFRQAKVARLAGSFFDPAEWCITQISTCG